jgi:hypothetical protein
MPIYSLVPLSLRSLQVSLVGATFISGGVLSALRSFGCCFHQYNCCRATPSSFARAFMFARFHLLQRALPEICRPTVSLLFSALRTFPSPFAEECPNPNCLGGLVHFRLDLTNRRAHTEACMMASLHSFPSKPGTEGVTNSVTNRLGNRGQSRATVTNFVTKLRAIQGNEITYFGESRAMEGN